MSNDLTYSRIALQLLVINSVLVKMTIAPSSEDMVYCVRTIHWLFKLGAWWGRLLYFVDTRFNFIVDQFIILIKVIVWALMPRLTFNTRI